MLELDEITDAKLDEIEALVRRWLVYRSGDMHNLAVRLIKALRACRQQIELVVENLDSFRAPVEVGGKQLSPAGRVFALGERDEKCRAQSKAKDAVIEVARSIERGRYADLDKALAALEAKGCPSRPS